MSNNNRLKYLAHILIVISFLLFASAAYINIQEYNSLSIPKVITNEPTSIVEEPEEVEETTTQVIDKDNNIDKTKDNNVRNSNNTNKQKNIKTGENKEKVKVVTDTNNELREEMEYDYSINIKYGNEVGDYKVGGLKVTPETDSKVIDNALKRLNADLALYPDGMLDEVQNNSELAIYLVKNYSKNNVTGVTDSTGNPTIISISTERDFDDTVHHELYHYFEKYMMRKGASYTSWDNLNPTDFRYGNTNTNLVYSKTLKSDAFFVNVYSQTSAAEDRASTFEYMMASSKASCLNKNNPINRKAVYMANMMDYYIDACSSNTIEYWERYL